MVWFCLSVLQGCLGVELRFRRQNSFCPKDSLQGKVVRFGLVWERGLLVFLALQGP